MKYSICFNLPEGREWFRRKKNEKKFVCNCHVSIYPKAEKGLRVREMTLFFGNEFQKTSFNLPEGREWFKRDWYSSASALTWKVSIYPKAENGLDVAEEDTLKVLNRIVSIYPKAENGLEVKCHYLKNS